MTKVTFEALLKAGVHFGHLKRKWNPKMSPYIFMEKNKIHIIDLKKTIAKIEEACAAAKQIAKSGRKILFVATKRQAKDIIENSAKSVNMPYVTERWPGGLLTNFATIRKTVRKMQSLDKLINDPSFNNLSKKERLIITRQREKLDKDFASIASMVRLPAALFIVDTLQEHIAVAEAVKLNIPIIGIVDTNADPTIIDFPIPANDDSQKSIEIIVNAITEAIKNGLDETTKHKKSIQKTAKESKTQTQKQTTKDKKSIDKPVKKDNNEQETKSKLTHPASNKNLSNQKKKKEKVETKS